MKSLEQPPHGKQMILVIDDEPVIRDLLCEVFDLDGFVAVPMGDADQAAAFLTRQAMDVALILTDVNMPGLMDGAALANHSRLLWPSIPVVVMSGLETLQSAGINTHMAFIQKPFSMEGILNVVHRELGMVDRQLH